MNSLDKVMARSGGLEPLDIQPTVYRRRLRRPRWEHSVKMVRTGGDAPPLSVWKTGVLLLHQVR